MEKVFCRDDPLRLAEGMDGLSQICRLFDFIHFHKSTMWLLLSYLKSIFSSVRSEMFVEYKIKNYQSSAPKVQRTPWESPFGVGATCLIQKIQRYFSLSSL